jgi:hypothetical protein
MEITGLLVKQTTVREGVSKTTGNPWKSAEYLVEIPGQYPRHINFRVTDGQVGRIARFDGLVGKMVTVSFDLDAHEFEGKWYNELTAWGVKEYIDQTTLQANIAAAQAKDNPAEATDQQSDGDKGDGLPF